MRPLVQNRNRPCLAGPLRLRRLQPLFGGKEFLNVLRALLIEDEEVARTQLRALLAQHSEIEIVGEAASVKQARALLARHNYDLVFLDIQLADGSGFEIIADVTPGAAIIFVSVSEEHALRAFDVNALDYLVKPVKSPRLAESLRRVAERSVKPAAMRAPTGAKSLRLEDTIHLNSGARAHFARVADISLVQAHENYSRVQLVDGTQILVRRTLKAWADSLPTNTFLQVHRATIVNISRVTAYERSSPRTISLRLTGVPLPVAVSRVATPEVKDRLFARFPELR